MTELSEWEGTAWAGSAPTFTGSASPIKASTGGGWLNAYQAGGINLSSLSLEPQDKASKLLKAYKVGWFNKASRKIATDFAGLKVSVMPEDDAGDNETEVVEPDLMTPWDQLDPVGRFLRLMEKPNPYQTGRQLRQKTMIRLDMAGWAFWYTELGSDRLPVENGLYGISPARLWPSYSKTGQIIGYVLDKDRDGGGIPFDVDEIIPFSYGSADDDNIYGVGVVEAIWAQIPLTDLMAKHTADVLTTGGRLAGAMWPKNRALEQNEFEDAQRAWRSVASDPNAARRLLLFPEPMEWSQGASSPAEIGIPELASLNRDDILTSFPISPFMLGVPTPGGLNSGEVRKEDRKDYWLGTIHPRVELFEETVQTYLLSRYEEVVGYTLDFEVEEPNLDDAAAIIEKAKALDELILAGFEEKEAVAAVGLEHIKYNGKPQPDPKLVVAAQEATLQAEADGKIPPPPKPFGKAQKSATADRDAVTDPATTRAKARLERFFTDQKGRVTANLRSSLPPSKAARMKAEPTWWDPEVEDEQLTSTMREIYADVGRGGLQSVANAVGRVIFKGATQAVIADLLSYGGERVKDINARTLQAITVELAEGTRRGYSIPQLIDGVAEEGYKGVLQSGLDNGVPVWSDLRAETIARTETMLSYNRATVTGYGEFGVTHLLAYDGDDDEECATRNGNEYTIDEAQGIEDHPNGTLVWSPVVDKAAHIDPTLTMMSEVLQRIAETQEALKSAFLRVPEVHITNTTPGMDAPIVHNHVAPAAVDVHVEPTPVHIDAKTHVDSALITVEAAKAPDVYVTTPEVNVAAPVVNVEPVTVTVEAAPAKKVTKTIRRDKSGAITHIEES